MLNTPSNNLTVVHPDGTIHNNLTYHKCQGVLNGIFTYHTPDNQLGYGSTMKRAALIMELFTHYQLTHLPLSLGKGKHCTIWSPMNMLTCTTTTTQQRSS